MTNKINPFECAQWVKNASKRNTKTKQRRSGEGGYMKQGIYLSPDGMHLVQILNVVNSRVYFSSDVYFGEIDHYVALDGLEIVFAAFFSSWIYLGEI